MARRRHAAEPGQPAPLDGRVRAAARAARRDRCRRSARARRRVRRRAPLLLLLASLAVVFGMLRRGTRRLAAADHPNLDERDVAARDAAFRVAFPLLVVVVAVGLALLALDAPDVPHRTRTGLGSRAGEGGWLVDASALLALALWIGLWAAFLPTGVLAWSEPDALEPDVTRVPEHVRDALLGATIVGGVAAGLLTGSETGLLALVAMLALLGALALLA
ncbi:MAG: hypothetical protein ACLGHP_10925, partial [Vicinamibacteria bacterium]